MGDAKSIEVKPITSRAARALVERVHYSGSTVNNSQIHLGVFLSGRLHGAMQFGPPLDRRKILPLVHGSEWGSVIELNRMAFDEALPRNSESRALSVAFRMFRANAPQVKWIVSFADGCQCGDGTIYRASGFVLTGIKPNGQIIEFPDGYRCTRAVLTGVSPGTARAVAARYGAKLTGGASLEPFRSVGAREVPGYQFRYVRFLDESWRARLTVPEIPFGSIPPDARMYLGRRPVEGPGHHPAEGGADPTPTLHGAK